MKHQPWPPPTMDEWAEETKANPKVLWWIDRLVPGDAKTLVSGPPKTSKKTLSALELVRCLITAKGMPGIRVMQKEPCHALFMEYEGPALPLVLFKEWMDNGAGWQAEWQRCRFAHRYSHMRITDAESVDKIVRLIAEEKLKGFVVDTFTRAAVANENDARALAEAFENLDRIRDATEGGWVLYIHHLRKASDPWDEDIDVQVRGNSAFSGDYDHHLAFREGYAKGSVHLYTRSKVDQDRFFRWLWRIDDKAGQISFDLFEFELDNPPPAGLVEECAEAIETTNVHTLRQLAELWDTPKAVTMWLTGAMGSAGILEKTARGWKKIGG